MTDFAAQRVTMVDTQVRPSDVTKFPIIDAMLSVPREAFVPQNQRNTAYAGENLAFAPGRVLVEARTLAKTLDALNIQPTELVLDVGAGYGYSSAVIARLAEVVVAIEELEAVAKDAQEALSETGADNVVVELGRLAEGAAEHGPYDVIILQGGAEIVPDALLTQLKDGGRMAALFMDGALGEVRIGYKSGGRVSWKGVFNASAPVLPGFERLVEFSL